MKLRCLVSDLNTFGSSETFMFPMARFTTSMNTLIKSPTVMVIKPNPKCRIVFDTYCILMKRASYSLGPSILSCLIEIAVIHDMNEMQQIRTKI